MSSGSPSQPPRGAGGDGASDMEVDPVGECVPDDAAAVPRSDSNRSIVSTGADVSSSSVPSDTSVEQDAKQDINVQNDELVTWLRASTSIKACFVLQVLESLPKLPDVESWSHFAASMVPMLFQCVEAAPSMPAPPGWLLRLLYTGSAGAERQPIKEHRRKLAMNHSAEWSRLIEQGKTADIGFHRHLREAFDRASFSTFSSAPPLFDYLITSFYDQEFKGDASQSFEQSLFDQEALFETEPAPAPTTPAPTAPAPTAPVPSAPASTPQQANRIYSRSVVILQSSGTGKSRMVLELGKRERFYVLAVCLRRDDPDGANGFPAADPDARDYLLVGVADEKDLMRRYATFYEAFFDEARSYIINGGPDSHRAWQKLSDLVRPQSETGVARRRETYSDDSQRRKAFLGRVVEAAKAIDRAIDEASPALILDASDPAKRLEERLSKAQEAAKRLADVLPKDGYFVIAMDEASKLAGALSSDKPLDAAALAMRRFWRDLDRERFWLVLIDTNQALTHLAPMKEASARLQARRLRTLPPYLDLPLDVHLTADETTTAGMARSTPLQLADLSRITRIGRPLWHSLGITCDAQMEFVALKVAGSDPSLNAVDKQSSAMGVLSQRLEVTLSTTTSARKFVERQVHYHLRYITAFSRSPNLLDTVSQCEPIPSIAASAILRGRLSDYPDLGWAEALDELAKACLDSEGPLDVGDCGELVAQALLSLAYDVASRDDSKQAADHDAATSLWVGSTFITVRSFLDSLLGSNRAPSGQASDAATVELLRALGDGYVRFTRFARAPSTFKEMKQADLLFAWAYGWAWLGAAGQEGWDMLIPIYCGPLDKPMDLSRLTALVVQVKNRKQPNILQADKSLPKVDWASSDGALPVCLLWLELGVSHAKAEQLGRVRIASSKKRAAPHGADFIVTAVGCEHATFPLLDATTTEHHLRQILKRVEGNSVPLPNRMQRLYDAANREE